MSPCAAVFYLLSHDPVLTATVPASRISSGIVPLRRQLPCIGIWQISEFKRTTIADNESASMRRARIQVTVIAESYSQKSQIFALIKTALANVRGNYNGVDVDSIVMDIDGPDIDFPEIPVYFQSIDFIVKYLE